MSAPAIVASCTVVLALAAGAAIFVARDSSSHVAAASSSHGGGISTRGTATSSTTTAPPPPLHVLSISPQSSASDVAWNATVTVRYSEALSPSTPLPTIRPAPQGSWDRVSSTTLEFQPTGDYVPFTKETVTVPASSASEAGTTLGETVTSSFTVAGGSILRLQELLGELGYLPLRFVPRASASPSPDAAASTVPPTALTAAPGTPSVTGTTVVAAPSAPATSDFEPTSAGSVPIEALPGKFVWRFSDIPPTLASLWSPGTDNEITIGAVMQFEAAHEMTTDGIAGPAVWAALLEAAASRAFDSAPYDYVYVTETDPEYVTVWRDGVNVFTTLANTGIPQAPTQAGTWPVYARYVVTTMKGTEPDGQTYSDPGIPWVSYFHGGDALHGYLRAQYGFPQSLGCVEMPYSSAKTVFPYTPLGTLVTVE